VEKRRREVSEIVCEGQYTVDLLSECCRSSVVEHPLGKGEVVGSIPTGSTSLIKDLGDRLEGRVTAAGSGRRDGQKKEAARRPPQGDG
jgi:hypothetical protein